MKVSRDVLNDIADNLETGFKCFLHKETLEVVGFPDEDRYPDADPEAWEEDIDKVFNDRQNYIEIEPMTSSESFKVIEDFVHSLGNSSTKVRLLQAIEGRKPFANFKHQIENSGDYREQWFAFRRNRHIEWVEDQLESEL